MSRACAACSVANAVAYAHAAEDALGLDRPRSSRTRTLLLELERMWNHLNDIAVCAGTGLAAGTARFAAHRAQPPPQRRAHGSSFLAGSVLVGGSGLEASAAAATDVAREEVAVIAAEATRSWRELLFNAFVSRTGCRRSACSRARTPSVSGRSASPRGRPASPRTSAPPARASPTAARAGRAAAGRGRRPGPARAACGRADPDVRAARRPARRSRPPGHRNAGGAQAARRRPG